MRTLLLAWAGVATADQSGRAQCDETFQERLAWGKTAMASLTENLGFTAASARLTYAPLGAISNPAGTYGALLFEHPGDVFPPNATDFCACLGGDTTVSPVCTQLQAYVTSGGDRENQCQGSYVLKPSDAVVVVGCAPPEAQYFGLQTNVLSKWNTTRAGGPALYYPEVSPFDSINTLVLNSTSPTTFGGSYVVVSTADKVEQTCAPLSVIAD